MKDLLFWIGQIFWEQESNFLNKMSNIIMFHTHKSFWQITLSCVHEFVASKWIAVCMYQCKTSKGAHANISLDQHEWGMLLHII